MIFELDQMATEMAGYHKNLEEMGTHFDIPNSIERVAELEEIAGDPEFWNDMEKAQGILQQTKQLKDKIEAITLLLVSMKI